MLFGSDFLKSWKAWVKKPLTNDRPGALDFTTFRCEHGQVELDPNNEVQMTEFAGVSPEEWAQFSECV